MKYVCSVVFDETKVYKDEVSWIEVSVQKDISIQEEEKQSCNDDEIIEVEEEIVKCNDSDIEDSRGKWVRHIPKRLEAYMLDLDNVPKSYEEAMRSSESDR